MAKLIQWLLASFVLVTTIQLSVGAAVDGSSGKTFPADCPMMTCTTDCEFDYVYDSNGCQTCDCLSNPCWAALCPPGKVCKVKWDPCFTTPCPPKANCVDETTEPSLARCPERQEPYTGYCAAATFNPECEDNSGCSGRMCCPNECGVLMCAKPECPMKKCTTNCEFDYVYDSYGCQTCDCLPNPCWAADCVAGTVCQAKRVQCFTTPCPPIADCVKECPLVKCSTECKYGFAFDEDNCQTCTCNSEPPTAVVDPGPVNQYSCPPVLAIWCNYTNPINCKADSECKPGQSCCATMCSGAECMDPYRQPVLKEGLCPYVDTKLIRCAGPEKNLHCTPNDDSTCSGTQKCCSTGCSYECRDAEPPKKGECPMRSDADCETANSCGVSYSDSECPDTQKCCWASNCGEMRCLEPVNPGYCPAPQEGMVGICQFDENACLNDFECDDSSMKCCPVNCNKYCVPSVQAVWKEGNCPNFDWSPMQVCDKEPEQCSNDVECGGTKKCCPSPCGPATQCLEPAVIKAGDCPPVNPLVDCAWPDPTAKYEAPACLNDEDCDGTKKCCPQTCKTSQCAEPVTPVVKPGVCPTCDPLTGANCYPYSGVGRPMPGDAVASPPDAAAGGSAPGSAPGSAAGAPVGSDPAAPVAPRPGSRVPKPAPDAPVASGPGAPATSDGGGARFPAWGGVNYCSSDAACWGSAKCCMQPYGGYSCSEIDICSLPSDTGRCKALFERWYFDRSAGKCLKFNYGGCEGNANNFEQESDCQASCLPRDTTDVCSLPQDSGPCEALMKMWSFDQASSQCVEFNYGGCEGNDNRFKSVEDCQNRCQPRYNTEVKAQPIAGEQPNSGQGGGAVGNPGQPQPGAKDTNQPPADVGRDGDRDGVCPADRVGRKYHTDVPCSQDGQCPGNKKCCSRAGDRVCRSADVPKPGTCPDVKKKWGKQVTSKCDSDSECCDNQKCCQKETGAFDCVEPEPAK